MGSHPKLLIFESHPVQYRAPVYRVLSEILREKGSGSMHVYYATDVSIRGHRDPGFAQTVAWDEPLLEGYPCSVVSNERGEPLSGFRSLSSNGVHNIVSQERPAAVMLTGLGYEWDWAAYRSARRLGIPVWIRAETQDHAFQRPALKEAVRRMFYTSAYRGIEKAMVIGKLNAEHYARHGLPSNRQHWSPYCVRDRFVEHSPETSLRLRTEMRTKLGFQEDDTVLMFCGKLQPKKNPMLILDALQAMGAHENSHFGVLFVGSGELEAALKRRVAGFKGMRASFVGFQNQKELPAYYLASDVLVLPSRQMGETWGLVANEALLAGKRLVLSQFVGSHADFGVLPSVKVFDGTLRGLVEVLANLPAPESTEGQRDFMLSYSVEAAAEGMAQALGVCPQLEPTENVEDMGGQGGRWLPSSLIGSRSGSLF